MLTVTINGREALPIRALEFVTNGWWSSASVAVLMYDPNFYPDPFYDFLSPQRRLPDGTSVSIKGPEFLRMLEQVHTACQTGDRLAVVRALYADVFVWKDIAKELFESNLPHMTEFQSSSWPERQRRLWSENPRVTQEELAVIMEGLRPYAAAEPATKSSPVRDAKGKDETLRQAFIDAATEMRAAGKKPTRRAVAKRIAPDFDLAVATIVRRTSATWLPRNTGS